MAKTLTKATAILALLFSIIACEKASTSNTSSAINALKQHTFKLYSKDEFSGSILIAKNEEILIHEAIGYFDRAEKKPLDTDAKFRLGSLNKMFTSVGILLLVEKGKINLDEPMNTYLPNFKNKSISEFVTVHHLLSHTGGTGDIFGPMFDQNRLSLKSHDDYVRLYEDRGATMPPGNTFQYSNFGFILLGKIIENVSGQDYYEFLKENLFSELDMKATGFEPEERVSRELTKGYMRVEDKWVDNKDTLPWRGTAAGGAYSTTGDLFKFAVALKNEKLISKETLNLATTKHVAMGDAAYGYGFGVFGEGESFFYGHNGGAAGMSSWLSIYPKSGYIIIVLSNYDQPIADEVQRFYVEQANLN
ncbi:penicillin-binding protein [Alteromonas sp. KUL42]|uniref:serine hydrolase domain-containing protein n=1 Tax=Alteromonas sp. KUL42 TaxID=2480797 RepID=UPI0010FFB184|nr:serine hydrolase domain-containing protein [Alteromonas sp. KUL42]GEA07740.1 penicillin-binding protein [Alteromonas sp. KUL42]